MSGCITCGGKFQRNNNRQINMQQFFSKNHYVGPTGNVTSVVPNIHYGRKETGELMFVHANDLEANPNLWVPEGEYQEAPEPEATPMVEEKTVTKRRRRKSSQSD